MQGYFSHSCRAGTDVYMSASVGESYRKGECSRVNKLYTLIDGKKMILKDLKV